MTYLEAGSGHWSTQCGLWGPHFIAPPFQFLQNRVLIRTPQNDPAAEEGRPLTRGVFSGPTWPAAASAPCLSRRTPTHSRTGAAEPAQGGGPRGPGKGQWRAHCGHTAAQPPGTSGDGIRAARPAHSPPATPPARHPHRRPLGSDPPSGSAEVRTGRGRGTGCAGHLSPMTRPPRGQPPGAGRQSCGPFPPSAPRGPGRKQVSRWWASWSWVCPRPASARLGRRGQAPSGLSF